MVREFEDKLARGDMPEGAEPQPRSPAMVRKVRVSLSSLLSDAQERGLVARNVVRELRRGRQRGAERRAEKRQKGKLKVGVDIPTRRGDQGHCGGRQGPLASVPADGDLHGPARLRASRAALGWTSTSTSESFTSASAPIASTRSAGRSPDSGERTVPLTPIVVNTLREWKLACSEERARARLPDGQRQRRVALEHRQARARPDAHCCGRHGRRERTRTASRSSWRSTPAFTPSAISTRHGASTDAQTAASNFRPRSFRNGSGIRRS